MSTEFKAVIYCRQSYTRDSDKLSINEQLKKAFEYAKKYNLKVVTTPFIDENTSSELYPLTDDAKIIAPRDKTFLQWFAESQRHSVQFNKKQIPYKINLGACFDFIEQNDIDYLIVWSFERLGRSEYSSCLQPFITDFLKSHNVKLIETKDESVTDYNNSNNQLLALIKSHIEYESLKTKKKSSINIIQNRIANSISASNAYGVIKKGKNIHFNLEKVKVIQYIYEAIIMGKSYGEILHRLNTDFLHLRTDGAKQFYISSIYNIASNPTYCGLMQYNEDSIKKYKPAANIPKPIINIALFYAVQQNMQLRKEHNIIPINPFGKRKQLPLSKIIYCSCGQKMSVGYDSRNLVYECKKSNISTEQSCGKIRIRMSLPKHKNGYLGLYELLKKLFIISFIDNLHNQHYANVVCEEENRLLVQLFNHKKEMQEVFQILSQTHRLDTFKENFLKMNNYLEKLEQKLEEVRRQKSQVSKELEDQANCLLRKIIKTQQFSEEEFFNLTHKTIKKIIVFDDKINISLKDGNCFTLPRIVGKRNLKYLPNVRIVTENIHEKKTHSLWDKKFHIIFIVKTRHNLKTLVDSPLYRISIRQ